MFPPNSSTEIIYNTFAKSRNLVSSNILCSIIFQTDKIDSSQNRPNFHSRPIRVGFGGLTYVFKYF